MPYININNRKRMYKHILALVEEVQNIGELKYVICELVGHWILKINKFSRQSRESAILAVHQAELELQKRIIDPYDFPITEKDDDLKSFAKIGEKMKWITGKGK